MEPGYYDCYYYYHCDCYYYYYLTSCVCRCLPATVHWQGPVSRDTYMEPHNTAALVYKYKPKMAKQVVCCTTGLFIAQYIYIRQMQLQQFFDVAICTLVHDPECI